jgi:hypothetical protein
MAIETYADTDTCVQCHGIVPDEGTHMVEEDGQLCTCAIDVWLRFENPDDADDEPVAEANTFHELNRFRVDWYLTSVGQVTSVYFDTYAEAEAWLTQEGFLDFTS